MNSTVKLAACLSVALVSSSCFAQSKDYIEIGYGKTSIKELSEIKPTGIALSAKKILRPILSTRYLYNIE